MSLSLQEECQLAKYEFSYWWHVAKRQFIRSVLERFRLLDSSRHEWVVDIGTGCGAIFDLFPRHPRLVLTEATLNESFRLARAPYKVVCLASHLPFRSDLFFLALAADVIEHIENVDQALGEVHRTLATSGHFFVAVPAHPSLFSAHDVALGHLRRYRRRKLNEELNRNHLTPIFQSFFFVTLLPAIGIRRLVSPAATGGAKSGYVDVPGWLNRLCIGWFLMEARLLRFLRLPIGSSLCALCRKKVD